MATLKKENGFWQLSGSGWYAVLHNFRITTIGYSYGNGDTPTVQVPEFKDGTPCVMVIPLSPDPTDPSKMTYLPEHDRFSRLLETMYGYGAVIPDEANWPIIYETQMIDQGNGPEPVEVDTGQRGLQMVGVTPDHLYGESQSIHMFRFAQLVGYQPGAPNEGVNTEARENTKKIIKYLRLLECIPVFASGDPVLPVAQAIGINTVGNGYPPGGYPPILTYDDAKELLEYFIPGSEPEAVAARANFVYSRFLLLTRARLSSLLMQEEKVNGLINLT